MCFALSRGRDGGWEDPLCLVLFICIRTFRRHSVTKAATAVCDSCCGSVSHNLIKAWDWSIFNRRFLMSFARRFFLQSVTGWGNSASYSVTLPLLSDAFLWTPINTSSGASANDFPSALPAVLSSGDTPPSHFRQLLSDLWPLMSRDRGDSHTHFSP